MVPVTHHFPERPQTEMLSEREVSRELIKTVMMILFYRQHYTHTHTDGIKLSFAGLK